MQLRFPKPLVEGLVLERPNRFIMNVEMDGQVLKAHCPSTGRIGNLRFRDIPGLVALSEDRSRTTGGTVEAISLDPPEKEEKSWIGIDQSKANDYVHHFLQDGSFAPLVGDIGEIEREVRLGRSRIDFRIDQRDFLEVKTPLNLIDCRGHPQCQETAAPFLDFERIIKHFHDIAESIEQGSRAIMLTCFLYDAPTFDPPMADKHTIRIQNAAKDAMEHGVEFWQANFKVDRYGVDFIKCFKLALFD